ncbi:transposase [Streptomyces sp.]|jgi:transposase|uniref:transposase n=1 Tax=Streptomyces sp. TaxID=1931 RepID=UPI0025F98BDA|nr:transposase [Streptomyces sp.]
MDVLVERVAGLDVSKGDVKACVRGPISQGSRRHRDEVRTFTTMTRSLLLLSDWLAEQDVQLVVMEATADYWKPVFYLLEERFEVRLVNARGIKGVPGRKTDVSDARWIAQVAQHGLVSPSFVPPPLIRRTMFEALIAGERDPAALADLGVGKARSKTTDLREALTGRFEDHHAFLTSQALAHIDAIDTQTTAFDQRIDAEAAPLRRQRDLLVTIPGISTRLAQVLIAETGTDMTRLSTAVALARWSGVAPGNNQSAGRSYSGATTHGNVWLKGALGDAAAAAAHTKGTYLTAHYRRLIRRMGKKRALVAVMHKIVIATWHMLTNDTDDLDPASGNSSRTRSSAGSNGSSPSYAPSGSTRPASQPLDLPHPSPTAGAINHALARPFSSQILRDCRLRPHLIW